MSEYTAAEKKIMDAMERVEGYRTGTVEEIKSPNTKPLVPTQSTEMQRKIAQSAEEIIKNSASNSSTFSSRQAETPILSRSASLAASFTPPKINTHVEATKEYLTSPSPQQVVVVNQNSVI